MRELSTPTTLGEGSDKNAQSLGEVAPCAADTIRGDHALEVQKNIVHGSDSLESAKRELALFFPNL